MDNRQDTRSVSEQFMRLGGSAQKLVESLGPLSDLIGTWVGSQGLNVIAVPQGESGFQLLVNPYVETVTFTPIGAPVPDRGGLEILQIMGLRYELTINDKNTNEVLHVENGMWLFLGGDAGLAGTIARQATVPHGNSLVALGSYSSATGAPDIPDINSVPDIGHGKLAGYLDVYYESPSYVGNPNQLLQEAIKGQDILQTTTLSVSTQNNGGIVNIPFIVSHANATAFNGTFWIETVKGAKGEYQQLQYSQQTNINFLPMFGDPGALIMWPHINVNTLVKQ